MGGETQIIGIAASVWEMEQETAQETSCDKFLVKPFTESQLYAIIDDCIKKISFNFPEYLPPERICPGLNSAQVRHRLQTLPTDVQKTLEKAVISLNSDLIEESLKQVGDYNPELMRVLQRLVQDFHHATILDWMQTSTSTFI